LADTAESTTTDLVAWIRSILPDVPTVARPLGAPERDSGVDLRLIRAAPRATTRSAETPAILDLDYLVTIQMADAGAEQHALVELLFAAAARPDSEVVTDQSVAELCATLGIPVATGFVLRTPLVRIPTRRPHWRSRVPLVVHSAELGVIEGRVIGPRDTPVAGAVITAAGFNVMTRSDDDGHFRLVGMPITAAGVRLTARASDTETGAVGVVGRPVILRLAGED
jgi:hypothetical protein